jgi:hypothetical protein
MTTPTITETAERRRTVAVATTGTVLALIAYTTPVGTLAATASGLGAGPSGQAWILSSMSCGLAVALLPAARSVTTTAVDGCSSPVHWCWRRRRSSRRSHPTP